MNKTTQIIAALVLIIPLYACSTPEEKAAGYVASADELLAEGKLGKAEIEYRNALQVNQNLPEAWFGLAKIHERKQEWRKAYAVLNRIRELAPNHVEGRIMLGQMLLASDQIDQALQDAREIQDMAPQNPRAYALMGAVQFRLENYPGAMESADKALAIDPANNEALLVRARVLIAEKSFDEAISLLDRAIDSDPDNVSFYLMKIQTYQETNNLAEIEKIYLALTRQFPDNTSFKHALARHYIAQKKIDEAEAVLQEIVEAAPSDVEEKIRLVGFKNQFRSSDAAIKLAKRYADSASDEYRYRFLLGELYEKSNQADKARAVYQAIVDDDGLNTHGIEARNKLAVLDLRAGKADEAKSLVEEVLGHDKSNENALLLKSGFQIAAQKFDDAIVNLRTVLRDNPDSIKALGLLGQSYEATGSGQLAEESYTKAFHINPGNAVIANRLTTHLMRKKKTKQADEVLTQSISSGNRSLDTLKILAQVKLALGEWDKAEQLARQLEKVEGQEALSQQVLGVVYQGKEKSEDSIVAFKKAHDLAPESAQPIAALVQAYLRDGKINEARKFLNSVISVHENNLTAHLLLGQLSLYEDKPAGAIKHFEDAIKVAPESDAGYRALAAVYLQQNKLDQAQAAINQGLSGNADRPMLSMTLASIYERSRQFDKAIALYESMLNKNPNQMVVKNNLASLLTDYGSGQDSVERARTISADLKSSPIPQFRDTYAWASVKSGLNLEEAIVILEGIVEENAQVDVYNLHLGEAYRKRGDNDKAIVYLNKAGELAPPGSPVAEQAQQALQQVK